MPILIFLITIPIIEIYLFAEIGAQIGGMWTIATILLTGFIGFRLVTKHGFATLSSGKKKVVKDGGIVNELFSALCVVLGGVFLIIPGFFTDIMGIVILLPPFQALLKWALLRKMVTTAEINTAKYKKSYQPPEDKNQQNNNAEIIEAEFTVIEEENEDVVVKTDSSTNKKVK